MATGGPLPSDFSDYPGGDSRLKSSPRSFNSLHLASIGGLVLLIAIYFYLRKDFAGVDTADARQLRSTVDTSSFAGRLYELVSPLALGAAFLAARWNPVRPFAILFYVVAISAFALSMILSGARFEMLPLILVYLSSTFIFQIDIALNNIARGIAIALFMVVLLAGGNALLNVAAFRGGGGGVESIAIEERGIMLWRAIGIENVPSAVGVVTGLFDEYIFRPILYFDFYRAANSQPPAWGGHQFSMLAWRLNLRDGLSIKEDVDAYYALIGIENNVWSTSLREMWIDFGGVGCVLSYAIIGGLSGYAKRMSERIFIAQYLYIFLLSYMIFSPVTSAFRAISMQATTYFLLFSFTVGVAISSRRRKTIARAHSQTPRW